MKRNNLSLGSYFFEREEVPGNPAYKGKGSAFIGRSQFRFSHISQLKPTVDRVYLVWLVCQGFEYHFKQTNLKIRMKSGTT